MLSLLASLLLQKKDVMLGKTKRGKDTKIVVLRDENGTSSRSEEWSWPSEDENLPVIYDKAADSQ